MNDHLYNVVYIDLLRSKIKTLNRSMVVYNVCKNIRYYDV